MFKFEIGSIVASTKFFYLIKNRGNTPEGEGLSWPSDNKPGYEILNLTTKSNYWVPMHLAHERYKLKSKSKAGMVLFG